MNNLDVSELLTASFPQTKDDNAQRLNLKKLCLVFWLEEKLTSIEPLSSIPDEENRREGCSCTVKWKGRLKNGSKYVAKILKISESRDILEKAQHEVNQQMEALSVERKKSPKKRNVTNITPQKPTMSDDKDGPSRKKSKAARNKNETSNDRKAKNEAQKKMCVEILKNYSCTTENKSEAVLDGALDSVTSWVSQQVSDEEMKQQDEIDVTITENNIHTENTEINVDCVQLPLYPINSNTDTSWSNVDTFSQEASWGDSAFYDINTPSVNYTNIQQNQQPAFAQSRSVYQLEQLKSYPELQAELQKKEEENTCLRNNINTLLNRISELEGQQKFISDITPKKVHFMKSLCRQLEFNSNEYYLPVPVSQNLQFDAHKEPEVAEPRFSNEGFELEKPISQPVSKNLQFEEQNCIEPEMAEARPSNVEFEWEKPISSLGKNKCELVEGSRVFLTEGQMRAIQRVPKAELKVRRLLDVFFPIDVLAQSCAYGKRSAKNKKEDGMAKSIPLHARVISAIQEYMGSVCRPDGTPELSESAVVAVINSRCSTARRTMRN